MAEITGNDVLGLMVKGIESQIKPEIKRQVIERVVEEFTAQMTDIVDELVCDMVVSATLRENPVEWSKELVLLIEWAKLEEEKKTKYRMAEEKK